MIFEERKCLRCGGMMRHGAVLPDPPIMRYRGRVNQSWMGQVVWQALEDIDPTPPSIFHMPEHKNAAKVYAFRCEGCGLLEFYALHSVPRPSPEPPPVLAEAGGEAGATGEAGDEGDSEL